VKSAEKEREMKEKQEAIRPKPSDFEMTVERGPI